MNLSDLNPARMSSIQISSDLLAACHGRCCENMHMGVSQKTFAYLVAENGIQDTTVPVGLDVTVTLLAPVP